MRYPMMLLMVSMCLLSSNQGLSKEDNSINRPNYCWEIKGDYTNLAQGVNYYPLHISGKFDTRRKVSPSSIQFPIGSEVEWVPLVKGDDIDLTFKMAYLRRGHLVDEHQEPLYPGVNAFKITKNGRTLVAKDCGEGVYDYGWDTYAGYLLPGSAKVTQSKDFYSVFIVGSRFDIEFKSTETIGKKLGVRVEHEKCQLLSVEESGHRDYKSTTGGVWKYRNSTRTEGTSNVYGERAVRVNLVEKVEIKTLLFTDKEGREIGRVESKEVIGTLKNVIEEGRCQ